MAFKKKNVDLKYLKFKYCTPGEIIAEGVYERQGESNYGINHHFRTEENYVQVLNSSGHLNWLLNEYAVFGDFCRVTYEGSEILEKGKMKGREAHKFSLEIDDDKFDKSFTRDTSKQSKTPPPKSDSKNVQDEPIDEELEDMTL
jgi:hypothetical protein